MHRYISLATLVATSLAQSSTGDSNASLNTASVVYACEHLSCAASNSNDSICSMGSMSGLGVGFVSDAIALPQSNTRLSLTLVDGYPLGALAGTTEGFNFSTRTLYLGAPADANLQSQSPACALMMQLDSATFPYSVGDLPSSYYQNTTMCPTELSFSNTLENVATYIQNFGSLSTDEDDDNNSASSIQCEALAQYVQNRIHNNLAFGEYYGALVSVVGGAISGPNISTTPARIPYDVAGDISSDSCQPVLPQTYQLYNVTAATEILRGNSIDQNSTYGGRTGFTPIVSVLYNSEDDSNPDVSFYCMHIYDTGGEVLPYSSLNYESKGPLRFGRSGIPAVVMGLVIGIWALL